MLNPFVNGSIGHFKSKRQLVISSRAVLLAMSVSVLVNAQADVHGSSGLMSIEEVVVVAAKKSITAKDYPGAVSIIDETTLATMNPESIADLASSVAGLSVLDAGARNPDVLVIRGVNFDAVGSNDLGTDGTTVASYVNSIPLQGYYSPPQFVLKDLEGIEILRGPQGTLYGASSLSGLLMIKTVKPKLDEFYSAINTHVSSTKNSGGVSSDTDIVINAPMKRQDIAIRALLNYSDTKGFIDNSALLGGEQKDINNGQIKAGRLSFLYQPSVDTQVNVMWQHQQNFAGDRQADNLNYTGTPFDASSRYLQPSRGVLDTAELSFSTIIMNDLQLNVAANSYDYTQDQTRDLTDLYHVSYGYAEDDSAYEMSRVNVKQHTFELRVATDVEAVLSGSLGLFFSDNTLGVSLDEYLDVDASDIDPTEYSATQDQTLKDYALFGELTWSNLHNGSVTLGARYFDYKDTAQACTSFAGDDLECYRQLVDENNTSFKLTGQFKINDALNVYSSISEGFRRGGANPGVPDEIASRRTYEPDSTLNVELGVKGRTLAADLTGSAAIYYIDWQSVQLFSSEVTAVGGEWVGYLANANDAVSQGIELELSYRLTDSIRLKSSYAYNDAYLSEDARSYNLNSGGGDNGYKNDRLPGSPKQQAHLSCIVEKNVLDYAVNWRVSVHYTGATTTQLNSEHLDYEVLSSYRQLSTEAGVSFNNMHVGLYVKNLTDERNVLGIQGDAYYGDKGQFEYVNRPRTVGVKVSIRI